jgi:DNA-binding HxlR family transcriptional regulator
MPAHRQWTPLARALTVAGDNWTLMIAVQLASGRTRLSELRDRLAGVSAGVLDRYLQRMVASGLITRTRFREMPPRVEVELTEAGRELLPIAAALARWGRRRAWTEPAPGEEVDLGALVRSLLLEGEIDLPDTTLALTMRTPAGESSHLLEVRDGRASFATNGAAAETAEIRIAGGLEAWVRALGPSRDEELLELAGRRELAGRVLAALSEDR